MEPARQIPLGVVAGALSDDPRAAGIAAHHAGFTGLQFDAITASLDLTKLSNSGRREFSRIITQQDQKLIGLRADTGPKGFLPGSDIDKTLWHLDRILETAAGLQAPLVCLDVGPLPAPQVLEQPPSPPISQAGLILLPNSPAKPTTTIVPPPDPVIVSQVDAALRELGTRADRYGVIVAMRCDLSSFSALHRAIFASGCSFFGLDLDPAALLRDDWSLDETLSTLGHQIRHVRGRDALAATQRRTRPAPIGKGSTNWPQLLASLHEADYQGWISVDPIELTDRAAGATAGLKFLSQM